MKHAKSFVISGFTNPSGEIVHRVSGWLDGKRIRKNFRTRAEAEAERDVLEVKRVQEETGLRPTVTRLSEDQLHEAEALFHKEGNLSKPLSFYVEFALANYHEPAARKSLADAAAEYIKAKEQEYQQDLISEAYLVRLRREMKRLQKRCLVEFVSDLTASRLVTYFEFGNALPKTYNNRRGTMSSFLKFALQRDWIVGNPLAKIPNRRMRRRRVGARTLSATEAKGLMNFVETNYPTAIPFFSLCLFAGIRPCLRTGEIVRLQPEHVRLPENIIRIDGEVSKVREPRRIAIQPNLAAWLRTYPLERFPIVRRTFSTFARR